MQARSNDAREYGVDVLNVALDGVEGTTAVHICFGYALTNKVKANVYDLLVELEQSTVHQISIETAQSVLDCSSLALLSKTIILGVLDLSTSVVETPEEVAARIRRALPYVSPERIIVAPDCGMKYLSRATAYGKLQAMVKGAEIVRSEFHQ